MLLWFEEIKQNTKKKSELKSEMSERKTNEDYKNNKK